MESRRARRRAASESGIVTFVGILLLVLGAFNVMDGLVALLNSSYFSNHLLFANFTAWGWVILILGVIQWFVGIAILNGGRGGQMAGIVLAALNAIVMLAYLDHHPAWAIIIIFLDGVIIYALTVHDSEFV
jgi:hypothetical protein